MKNIICALFVILFFCHCQDKAKKKNNKTLSDQEQALFQVHPASPEAFDKLQKEEQRQSPVGRLCAESKGYILDDWDALNECSWAVEKYQMELYPKQVSRSGDLLQVMLEDSILTVSHEAKRYFQFVTFLPKSKQVLLRILQASSCPSYWLIHLDKGERTLLDGRPVFDKDQQHFLLSTGACKSVSKPSISLWSLNGNRFEEVIRESSKAAIRDLIWEKDKIWLGKQGDDFVQIEF